MSNISYYSLFEILKLPKVTFYSILEEFDNEKLIWFFDFIGKINSNDAVQIKLLFQQMGNKLGAREIFFRHEGAAQALPSAKINFIEVNENLRLYCLRINENAVVVFNGGYKDAKTAQESKISYHFQQANIFSKKIQKAILEKHIQITNNNRLKWDNDLLL